MKAQQSKYERACVACQDAEAARDKALKNVGAIDVALDRSLEKTANALVTAELGARANPFKSCSKYSVSAMQKPGEVHALAASILEAKPPAPVVKAVGDSTALADKVSAAIKAVTGPQAAYSKALLARDALLPDLLKRLSILRKHAEAAFAEEPGAVKMLFAPAGELIAPMKQAAKKEKNARAAKKAKDDAAPK